MPRQPHPSRSVLTRFAQAEATTKEARRVVVHLLGGCQACQEVLRQQGAYSPAPSTVTAVTASDSYDDSYERALAATRQGASRLARESQTSHDFARLLLAQPRPRQHLLLANSERGRVWPLCRELLARSFALRGEDPSRMLELADLAFRVAGRLDPNEMGRALTIDLQARVAAELANALRVADRLDSAVTVIAGVFQLLPHGTGDPLLKARVYDLASSIYRHRRDLALAAELLERAYQIYRRLDDAHLAGRVLVKRGLLELHRGEPARTLELSTQALEQIDSQREPELVWSAVHNIINAFVDLGWTELAARLLDEARPLYQQTGGELRRLRLRWLEARIAVNRRRPLDAERKLVQLGQDFEAVGQPFDAALVRLDLALLLGRQGRVAEVRLLVAGMLTTFRALEVDREAITALLVLQDALERQKVPVALIEHVRLFVARSRHEAGLRFGRAPRH